MNQTFDIHRFGKYLKFYILNNWWLFGVFALLTIATSVTFASKMPEDNITPIVVFSTTIYGLLMLSIMPNLDATKVSGLGRMISIPASSAEKFVSEFIVKLVITAIPFIVFAIFGISLFPKSIVGWFVVATITASMLSIILSSNFQWQCNNGKVTHYGLAIFFVIMIICCLMPQIGARYSGQIVVSLRESIINPAVVITLFAVSFVLLCLSYYFYKRRNVKF